MALPFSITRDNNGYPSTGEHQCVVFTDLAQYFTLTANTVKSITVPTGNYSRLMAQITYGIATGNPVVWVLPAASPTLTLPSGTVTLTLAEMNPDSRVVFPGQTLQMLTDQSGITVSILYYTLLA